MKKMKNIFFMLLIAMSIMCTVAHAEPEAAPADAAAVPVATEAPAPTEAPTPEPTVAPELASNQIDAKTGVTGVIFKIKHTDTIDISIISPSNNMLNTSSANVKTESVAGGTVVTVATEETGVWTINPTSSVGEEISVESECSYNFFVELKCESVIYNGISSKFIAFVKSKDGTNVDPNLLRTSTMTLYVLEEGKENPSRHEMTFRGAAYETSYTYNDVGRLSIWAVAEINGADVESTKADIISILDPNESSGVPIWLILLIVVIFTAIGVYLYIRLSSNMKNTKGSKNMSGTVTVNIAVGNDNKLPINRNLAMLGSSIGMLNIIGDDEYYDVDGITITGGDKGLKVINKSRCDVRYSNAGSDPNGVTLLDGQYFKIFMPDEKTTITVTYHSEDVFTSLMNAAAAEQQKQQEAAVAAAEAESIANAEAEENTVAEETTPAPEVQAEETVENVAEETAPALESLNLSEATEDAVPEVQAEEVAPEVSDEAVEESTSFTIDTTDAEEAPKADEEEYSFDTAPALEGFSFSGLAEEAEKIVEETAEKADDMTETVAEEVSSFTIDTTDAEEAPKADEEDYSFDTAPALEGFSFSGLTDEAEKAVDEAVDTVEEKTESLFGDLASLAAQAAGEADNADDVTEVIEDTADAVEEKTESLFGDLASLAAEAAGEVSEKADDVVVKTTTTIEDSNDAIADAYANLQSLADELTKE